MTSSSPHEPLKETIVRLARCREIMTARLYNGALTVPNEIRAQALQFLCEAQISLEAAFSTLFPEDD